MAEGHPRSSLASFAATIRAVFVAEKIRDTKAEELQLDPSLIAAKASLEALAFRPEETLPKLMPWQRELLGV